MHARPPSRPTAARSRTRGQRRNTFGLAVVVALALVACGGGGDDADVVDPGGAAPPPAAASLAVLPRNLALAVDGEGRFLPLHADAAVTWTSSDPAVASIDADGRVSAKARGSAVITALSASGATATAGVKVYRTSGAGADATSSALIADALATRRIGEEDALAYRVLAAFGDDRLPAEYAGAPDAAPDHGLLRQVASRFPSLSQARQDLLLPFLLPPMHAGGWLSLQTGTAPVAAAALGRARAQFLARQATTIDCTASARCPVPSCARRPRTSTSTTSSSAPGSTRRARRRWRWSHR